MNIMIEQPFIPINEIIKKNFSQKNLSDQRLAQIKYEIKKKLPIIMLGGEPHLDLICYLYQVEKNNVELNEFAKNVLKRK